MGRAFSSAGAGYGLLAPQAGKANLIFPDGFRPSIVGAPSPPVTPLVAPLNVMPIAQPVDRGNPQVIQRTRIVQHAKLAPCKLLDSLRQSTGALADPNLPCFLSLEAFNHEENITYHVI